MSDALLAFAGVTAVRGGRRLFADLSFALHPGDALFVEGANGAGKSSLIRIAAGLLDPAEGTVTRPVVPALLAEAHALDPELPLCRALGFWAALDEAADRLDGALAAMALDHLRDVPVRLLSTGQRRRAALARVVASPAPVWLLDEPASGLDTASLLLLDRAIASHRAGGGAVLVASHQPVALPAAMRIAL